MGRLAEKVNNEYNEGYIDGMKDAERIMEKKAIKAFTEIVNSPASLLKENLEKKIDENL